MLPAFVITGFLGSGKTTLLINSARTHFKGRRTAVIVNELGKVGVDGKVLENAYSSVLELPEGCICCTLHAEFEKAIGEIKQKYDPEVLFVETSGSAEPLPVVFNLKSLGFSVDGVLCVIDAKNFERYSSESTALYQLGGSNIAVINKIDLVSEEELKNLERKVLELWEKYAVKNVFTGERVFKELRLYKTSYGVLPEEVFAGAMSLNQLLGLAKDHHHHSHPYAQHVKFFKEAFEYEDLVDLFKSLPKDVIRAKGIVRLKHAPYPFFVNYVFGTFELGEELPNYKGESFVVFISKSPFKVLI
jgi:G3E family GTPase